MIQANWLADFHQTEHKPLLTAMEMWNRGTFINVIVRFEFHDH